MKRLVLGLCLAGSLLACGGGNPTTPQSGGADTTAPTLTSSTPANNASSIAVNTNIQLVFSEKMNTASVTVTSGPNGDLGDPAWNATGTELGFDPPANLGTSSDYTLSIIGKDVAGNALATSLKFATAGDSNPPPPADTTAPSVTSSSPTNGSTDAAINSKILINFSEAMDPSSVAVSIVPNLNLGSASFKSGNANVEFNPTNDLAGETNYTVSVGGKDLAGNALTGSSSFKFKTATTADTTAPGIPQNLIAETGDSQIKLTWNANTEPDLKGYTVYYGNNASNLSLSVFVAKPGSGRTLTGLTNGEIYFYQLEAEDGAGNRSGRTITKNTTPKDDTPPKLLSSTPSNRASNVLSGSEVVFNFSESMDLSANITYFKVTCRLLGNGQCNTNSSYSQSNGDRGLKLTGLSGGLGSNAEYSIELLAMRDKSGNPLPQSTITFSVADTTAPSLISSLPLNNAQGLPTSTGIVMNFSEPMATTETQTMFRAHYRNGPTINGSLSWSNDDKTLSFQPGTPISNGGLVDWLLSADTKDRAGNAITIGTGQSFRAIRQTVLTLPAFASGHLVLACPSDFSGTCGITKYFNETVMRVGDRVKAGGSRPYESSRGLLSFSLRPTRPANARLVNARIQVKRNGVSGDPANTLGELFIENTTNGNPLADGTPGDYRSAFWDHTSFGKLRIFSADINEDISSITSPSDVQFLTYRLYFATDYADNNVGDFYDYAKDATLSVTYQFP